ncbi:MAG TPA: glycosyltransferase family 39 protein [Polyangiaceae bacterium]
MTTSDVPWQPRAVSPGLAEDPLRPLSPRASSAGTSWSLPLRLAWLFDRSSWAARAAWLVIGASVVRLAIIASTGLSDTESYYYVWSRFLDWSYYDHPPMVAWLTRLTTLAGASPFTVRIGSVLCAGLFQALLYRLAARMFSPRAGFVAVAIVTALPAFLFTSFLANPEAPLAPLWVLYLLLLDDLRRGREAWRPLVLGLVIGVAFLAKFTAVLAVPLAVLVVAVSPDLRHWLRRPSFYAGGFVALAVAAPVIVWNQRHGWPSLALHLVERMPAVTAHSLLTNAGRAAVGQLLLFHPLVFPALLAALAMAFRRAPRDPRYRFLAWTSGPVLLFFFAVMAKACDAEPHWTMVGYMPLAVAAAGWLDERLDAPSRALGGYLRVVIAFSAAVGALYVVHMRSPVLLRAVPASLYGADADPINETLGWDRVHAAVLASSERLGPDTVVASHHNVLCGHVAAELGDRPPVYCVSPRRTEFDFLGRRTPPPGAPVVFVESARYPAEPSAVLEGMRCRRVETIDVERGGVAVGRYRVHECVPPAPMVISSVR